MNINDKINLEIHEHYILSELGVELYKLNNQDIACLDDAILFRSEGDRLKNLLQESLY